MAISAITCLLSACQTKMIIDQYPGKQKIHANIIKKMPLPPPKERTAHGTYLYLTEPGMLETFMRDYRLILMDNFQKIRIEGGGEYWTCGQDHDPRNWNWKPWQHLERLYRRQGLDDFAVREILEGHLGWNILEPLKEHGYIQTYQRTEGLNGVKYIITRQ